MQIAAIMKARTLAFIELDELNKGGRIRLTEVIKPLVEQFDFQSFPTKLEDFDLEDKGVTFSSGRFGDIVIDTLQIYSGAIYVESLSSTNDSQKALLEILEWGKENLGLTYREGMIRRWAFISDILFYTDFPILKQMSGPLSRLADSTSEIMDGLWGGLKYQPLSFNIGHDPTIRKHGIAGFSIQHRVNSHVGENKYFSEAPIPTDLHIKLLQEFERDVLEGIR
jgi:hypothetical protein